MMTAIVVKAYKEAKAEEGNKGGASKRSSRHSEVGSSEMSVMARRCIPQFSDAYTLSWVEEDTLLLASRQLDAEAEDGAASGCFGCLCAPSLPPLFAWEAKCSDGSWEMKDLRRRAQPHDRQDEGALTAYREAIFAAAKEQMRVQAILKEVHAAVKQERTGPTVEND